MMYHLLSSLSHLLPCKKCRDHFASHMKETVGCVSSPVLDSRESLSRWVVDLHNKVSEQNGKRTWSYEHVRTLYSEPVHTCAPKGGGAASFASSSSPLRTGVAYLVGSILVAALSAWAGGLLFNCRKVGGRKRVTFSL